MTTTTASASAPVSAPPRLRPRVRVGQILLTLLLLVSGLFGSSVLVTGGGDRTAAIEAASFAFLAVVLGLVAVWAGVRSRAIRLGLVALPLFFVIHVAAFGTWIPDAVFAVASAIAIALITGAGRD